MYIQNILSATEKTKTKNLYNILLTCGINVIHFIKKVILYKVNYIIILIITLLIYNLSYEIFSMLPYYLKKKIGSYKFELYIKMSLTYWKQDCISKSILEF